MSASEPGRPTEGDAPDPSVVRKTGTSWRKVILDLVGADLNVLPG